MKLLSNRSTWCRRTANHPRQDWQFDAMSSPVQWPLEPCEPVDPLEPVDSLEPRDPRMRRSNPPREPLDPADPVEPVEPRTTRPPLEPCEPREALPCDPELARTTWPLEPLEPLEPADPLDPLRKIPASALAVHSAEAAITTASMPAFRNIFDIIKLPSEFEQALGNTPDPPPPSSMSP